MNIKGLVTNIKAWAMMHPILTIVLIAVIGIITYFIWKAILAIVLLVMFGIVTIFALIGVNKTNVLSRTVKLILTIIIPLLMISSVISIYENVGILDYNPETNSYEWWVGIGRYYIHGGQTDINGNANELLDSDRYVTSWKSDGLSEKIVAIAYNEFDDNYGSVDTTNHVCKWAEWKVYLDPHANWDNPAVVSTPSNPNSDVVVFLNHPETGYANPGRLATGHYSTHEIIEVRGSYGGWYIRVIFRCQMQGVGSTRTIEIHDDARLLDGSGNVEVVYPYDGAAEEGDTVTFHVTTGASGPSVGNYTAGWKLTLYYPDNYPGMSGQVVEEWPIPDNVNGYSVEWTVPAGAWQPNIHTYKVVLYNLLIDQSQEYVVVVDNRSRMPSPPTIIAPRWVNVSEHVTANISAAPNEVTNLPIDHIAYAVWYGEESQNDYIIYWTDEHSLQQSGNEYGFSFSFTPTKPAIVTIGAIAYDTEGRMSKEALWSINVGGFNPPGHVYIPGQTLKYHLDDQHSKSAFLTPPTKVLYQFIDPNGKVIYELEKSPDSYYETSGYWHVVDDVSWTVPAFAKTGVWRMHVYIGSSTIPFMKSGWTKDYSFKVEDAPLGIDMFAPLYLHYNMIVYTVNWQLPSPGILIGIFALVIGIIIWQRERIMRGIKKINLKE